MFDPAQISFLQANRKQQYDLQQHVHFNQDRVTVHRTPFSLKQLSTMFTA